MHNKRNVIVMFLLIMLSFAIITEVSAASEAEINGTGSNPSEISVDMNHDIASERNNENFMQNHVIDDVDDFQSHNDQNSFDKTPKDFGDNNRNENLYEHDMDLRPNNNQSGEFNHEDMFKPNEFRMFDNPLDSRSMDNFTEGMFKDRSMGDLQNGADNFKAPDLKNDNFINVPNNGELMNDVASKLVGLENMAPNFKKDDKNIPQDNMTGPRPMDGRDVPLDNMTGPRPMDDKNNTSVPVIPGDKNSSNMNPADINKNTKPIKLDKKSNKKAKVVKKAVKKAKSNKKTKMVLKKLPKKSNKERAKL